MSNRVMRIVLGLVLCSFCVSLIVGCQANEMETARKVANLLKSDPEFRQSLTGPQGPKGDPGPQGPAPKIEK